VRHAGFVVLLAAGLGTAGAAPDRKGGGVVRVEHRDPATAPTHGHPDALVTVEYFFVPITQAGSRLPQFRALERLQAKHPGRVRVIYRVVKLTGNVQLPVAALEAQAQGKFFEFMEALHAPRSGMQLTKEQILELARGIGMDDTRLAAAISDGRYTDTFAANEQRMQRLHANEKSVLFNSQVVKLTTTPGPTESELETAYKIAYGKSLELIDQGYEARDLPRVYDQQARRAAQPFVSTGPTDDDPGGDPTEHKLAKPPLDLAGLPTFGKPDARAPQPIVVLCRPNDGQCVNLMRLVQRKVQEVYLDEIRAVWGPFFDVTAHENASELTMLGDAALCAEQIGANPDSLNASPGWRWISRQLDHASRSHGRRIKAEALIDTISGELDIDTSRLSACRARLANATLDFITKARKSGVTRSPALIIGGRIYEGQIDETSLQRLIEAELAPGMLGETADSMFDRLLFFLSSPKGK
jgi:protein-disulfide isomerase